MQNLLFFDPSTNNDSIGFNNDSLGSNNDSLGSTFFFHSLL